MSKLVPVISMQHQGLNILFASLLQNPFCSSSPSQNVVNSKSVSSLVYQKEFDLEIFWNCA